MAILKHLLILSWLILLAFPVTVWSGHDGYKQILKDWTRDDEAYNWSGIEARLVWFATYLSPDFRQAKVDRYAELYELPQEQVERMRAEEMLEGDRFDSFFLAIYAGSRVYPDVGKDRNLWKLVLETSDGDIVEPELWEEVPKNQVTRTLFPYIDRWSRLFEVKFPKSITSSTARAKLKMVGVPADSTLEWDLKRSQHSKL